MEITDNELSMKCMNLLMDNVGPVNAERFISIVIRDRFDYTEWQRDLYKNETLDSLGEKLMAFDGSAMA